MTSFFDGVTILLLCDSQGQIKGSFVRLVLLIQAFYRLFLQTESNGTVLSTNWDEVGKGKVEMKPPDGMEYKEYPK